MLEQFTEDEVYLLARWHYLMGDPILSDPEYDRLDQAFKERRPDDIHSSQTWSMDECPVELLTREGREDLIINTTMGYMAESIPSINTLQKYEEFFRGFNKEARVSFKIDGWNHRVSYFNGNLVKIETRGRGGSNLNHSGIAKIVVPKIPIQGRVAVTGELSIPNEVWPEFKSLTGNVDQRSSVRTAVNMGNPRYLGFAAFNIFVEDGFTGDQYAKLQELGFTTPYFKIVHNKRELDAAIEYMSSIAEFYDYLTDGLVVESEGFQVAVRLGKWAEQVMSSKITGYEINPGMYGCFIKARCNPVSVEGKTYTRLNVNNLATIIEQGLYVGSPVAFSQRSSANVVIDATATRELQRLEAIRA